MTSAATHVDESSNSNTRTSGKPVQDCSNPQEQSGDHLATAGGEPPPTTTKSSKMEDDRVDLIVTNTLAPPPATGNLMAVERILEDTKEENGDEDNAATTTTTATTATTATTSTTTTANPAESSPDPDNAVLLTTVIEEATTANNTATAPLSSSSVTAISTTTPKKADHDTICTISTNSQSSTPLTTKTTIPAVPGVGGSGEASTYCTMPQTPTTITSKKRKLSGTFASSTTTGADANITSPTISSHINMNASNNIAGGNARSTLATPPLVDYPSIAQTVRDIFALLQTYGPLTYAQLEHNLPPLSGTRVNQRSLVDILEILVAIGLVQKVKEEEAEAEPDSANTLNNDNTNNTRYCMLNGVPRADVVQPSTLLDQIKAAQDEIRACHERSRRLEKALLAPLSNKSSHRELLKSLVAEYPEITLDPVYVAALRNLHVDIAAEQKVARVTATKPSTTTPASKTTLQPRGGGGDAKSVTPTNVKGATPPPQQTPAWLAGAGPDLKRTTTTAISGAPAVVGSRPAASLPPTNAKPLPPGGGEENAKSIISPSPMVSSVPGAAAAAIADARRRTTAATTAMSAINSNATVPPISPLATLPLEASTRKQPQSMEGIALLTGRAAVNKTEVVSKDVAEVELSIDTSHHRLQELRKDLSASMKSEMAGEADPAKAAAAAATMATAGSTGEESVADKGNLPKMTCLPSDVVIEMTEVENVNDETRNDDDVQTEPANNGTGEETTETETKG